MSDVTLLLQAIADGDQQATGQLLPLVYDELRRIARAQMARERPEHTLQATALVHEAYLRLVGDGRSEPADWQGKRHFLLAAAEAMRRILIDNARRRQAQKRGGAWVRQELDAIAEPEPDADLLALDEALEKLAAADPAKAELVKLRYFAGLTGDEAAQALGISPTTADRHWAFARTWLQAEIRGR